MDTVLDPRGITRVCKECKAKVVPLREPFGPGESVHAANLFFGIND